MAEALPKYLPIGKPATHFVMRTSYKEIVLHHDSCRVFSRKSILNAVPIEHLTRGLSRPGAYIVLCNFCKPTRPVPSQKEGNNGV